MQFMSLPLRNRSHELETISENYFKNNIPTSWIVNKPALDYGTDYDCEIVIDNEVTGMTFLVQLKATQEEVNEKYVKVILKKTTINRWLVKLNPTILIAYVDNEKEAYWMWFEDNKVDLTLKNKTYTINIPKLNKLSTFNWNECIKYVENIFKKRYLLHSIPNVINRNGEAWKFYVEENYQKALTIFYEILDDDLNNTQILEVASLCEYKIFNYQKALILINRALDIQNNESFRLNKASILTEQGNINNDKFKINEAITIFKDLINDNYISDTIYYNLGSALSRNGDYRDSIEYFKKAIQLNPNKVEIWNNLGNSYMNLNIHTLEMECYEKALSINPEQPETLFSMGSSMFKFFGIKDKSLELMLKAASLTDRYEYDNPNFFFWIAQIYIARSEIDKAKEWNKRGLKHFSSDTYLIEQSKKIEN